jgi:flagellar protein FliO/FliZ
MIGRLLLALCFVLGLMWAVGRWAKVHGRGGKGSQVLTVLARQQLSRNSSVALVRVLDRAIVLGVTDGQISMLGDADLIELEQRLEAPTRTARRAATGIQRSLPVAAGRLDVPVSAFIRGSAPPSSAIPSSPMPSSPPPSKAPRPTGDRTPLTGSALSLHTGRQAIAAVRERTVRR